MKRLTDFLSLLGALIAVGAFAWSRTGRELPGGLRPYLIAAGVLVLAHLLVKWEDVAALFSRRTARYGTNTALTILIVLGLLGALNWMATRYFKRFDLTKGQRYSLSDQTKKVVSGLKDEIKITYFQRAREMQRGQDRLKDYQALSDKLKVEFVDPVQKPARAQTLDVRGPWPILVIERGDVRERATNDSEQDITNAIIKITREGKKTVCFAEGEGERDIDDSGERGMSGAKTSLAKNQYETKKVLLLREKAVPKECTVFVVGGPQKDLLPEAISPLRDYVKGGGKLLVMDDAPTKDATPNLDALLKEWNVEAGKDVVVDVSGMGQLFGAGEFTPIAMSYPYHEITKDFRVMTAFHMARGMQAGTASIEGVSAQNLLETSRESWAETDLSLRDPIAYDEGKDKKGPISLGVVVTVRGKAPEPVPTPSPSPSPGAAEDKTEDKPKAPEGRLVAFGDADFASNALLGFQGNQDFFLNVVAWLAEDADLISIRAKDQDDQRMFLTQAQKQNVAWVALLFLPGIFVVLGVRSWWRRR
jgi:ABC-type uncharacterized transport system involved in gliding motility auxiliary subunit